MKKIAFFLLLFAGTPAAAFAVTATDPRDPYQNVYDDESMKTYFMRRLANDVNPDDPAFTFTPTAPDLLPPAGGGNSVYTKSTSAHPQGKFYLVQNSVEIDDAFNAIARRIKMRLVE